MHDPYAPHEMHSQIVEESMWLQGALVANIVYGVEVTLYGICLKHLVQQANRSNFRRHAPLLIFITLVFLMGTQNMWSNAVMTQLSFIEDRRYPGGPAMFEKAMFSIPIDEAGVVACVLSNWLADALLVWRCMVVYTGVTPILFGIAVLLPCLMMLASIALGVMYLVGTSKSSPFNSFDISLPYFATTLALNVLATIMIVSRLLYCRRSFRRLLGAGYVSYYASLATILAESASLFAVFTFLWVLTLALDSPLASIFTQTIGPVQAVSSLLIIFYVVTGRGLKPDNGTTPILPLSTLHTIQFRDAQSSTHAVSEARPESPRADTAMLDEMPK